MSFETSEEAEVPGGSSRHHSQGGGRVRYHTSPGASKPSRSGSMNGTSFSTDRSASNRYGSHWWDMYRYVINTKDSAERQPVNRISHDLRGHVSQTSLPDKSELVFVRGTAPGIQNLYIMARKDNSLRQITFYTDWHPVIQAEMVSGRFFHRFHHPQQKPGRYRGHQPRRAADSVIWLTSPGQDRDPAWTCGRRSPIFSIRCDRHPEPLPGVSSSGWRSVSTADQCYRRSVFSGGFSRLTPPLAFSYYGPDGL